VSAYTSNYVEVIFLLLSVVLGEIKVWLSLELADERKKYVF